MMSTWPLIMPGPGDKRYGNGAECGAHPKKITPVALFAGADATRFIRLCAGGNPRLRGKQSGRMKKIHEKTTY
ncbi:hypothetical protein ACL2XP_00265 [Sodalis sp. RH21]|uniref:hypothetical protein n=1 Tax=unclassified Sodalis (in: enterobacteria) TaxID=2636512 RepID=UPI0039B3B82D